MYKQPTERTAHNTWYEAVRHYTTRLVNIHSVSPSQEENRVAQEVLRLLSEDGLDRLYTAHGLDPIEGDLYGRHNAYALLRGESPRTLVLLGHIDTVGTSDYGVLERWALDPEGLAERLDTLVALTPQLQADIVAHPDDWMFGRGVADMKSGVAVNIALIRRLAEQAQTGSLPLSCVFLAVCDEENESAGVLQAVHLLSRLRPEYGLEYVGAINTDYTTSLYPGDPHRYVYTGTIGKLLPSFLVIGRESHVGDPFNGVDANLLAAELIRTLSMNDALCDSVRGQITAPPVTLKATDLKTHYDVQLPFMAYFYLNVLTFTTTPAQLLQRLCSLCKSALTSVLASIDQAEQRWMQASGDRNPLQQLQSRSGVVLTYAHLYAETVQRLGEEQVQQELAEEWERWPADLDKRERSLHLVHRLWTLSGRQGPAVVVYYAPPYYPHVAATPSALHDAVAAVIAAHPELHLVQQEYFPLLSDLSYLRLDPDIDCAALSANMPVWRESDAPPRPGSYSLPLATIRELALPVVDFGVYGRGAHQRGERVFMSYSFEILPQLLYEVIERLERMTS
ncbi:MAG TPA: M20/M25/M40 family metallo-hydrolase [Ktedonobacteraceae bacterium]|nr:M20/M25/M40 family metallo-hydrolase [Ktedonobacteraceae bacterium]